jgi:hypothetical protein
LACATYINTMANVSFQRHGPADKFLWSGEPQSFRPSTNAAVRPSHNLQMVFAQAADKSVADAAHQNESRRRYSVAIR